MSYLASAPDLADFVQALATHRVRFMVVGGHAVGVHSVPRATKDLDIWIEPTAENRAKVIEALIDYGAPPNVCDTVRGANDTDTIWFGRPPNRIDLLQTLPGVTFADAIKRALYVDSGGQQIPIIGLDDLIANKEAVSRDQDRVDVKLLRQARDRSTDHR